MSSALIQFVNISPRDYKRYIVGISDAHSQLKFQPQQSVIRDVPEDRADDRTLQNPRVDRHSFHPLCRRPPFAVTDDEADEALCTAPLFQFSNNK